MNWIIRCSSVSQCEVPDFFLKLTFHINEKLISRKNLALDAQFSTSHKRSPRLDILHFLFMGRSTVFIIICCNLCSTWTFLLSYEVLTSGMLPRVIVIYKDEKNIFYKFS